MPRTKTFDEKQVLQKAMVLFWKKGFYATSIQDLVDYLGINRASLYDTYGGKRELFNKALQHYQSTNSELIFAMLRQQPDVREGIRQLLQGAIDAAVADTDQKGCLLVNSSTELLPSDVGIQHLIQVNQEKFESFIFEYLLSGQKKGQIVNGINLQSVASLIFTFYNGLKVISKIKTDRQALLKQANLLLSLLD